MAGVREDTEETAEGLHAEISLLRKRLLEAMEDEDVDLRRVAQGMNALVRAVATEHRMSPKASQDLADNIAAVLNHIGDQLLPADR